MNKALITLFVMVYVLGIVSGTVYSIISQPPEQPATSITNNQAPPQPKPSISLSDVNNSPTQLEQLFDELTKSISLPQEEERDKISPHDWLTEEEIRVYQDRVIITVDNPRWAMFTDTKSMDPVIDGSSHAIEIIPESEDDVHIGDIVAYESEFRTGVVTHRVIEIGEDAQGWYARLQGDNNAQPDPGKVRFDQIKRIVIAIIY